MHLIRPFSENSRLGLEILQQQLAQEEKNKANGAKIRLAVLSGRDPDLHELTRRQLSNSGRGRYFDELSIYLSTVASSSGYKEGIVESEIRKGNSVVVFDDDITAGIRTNRAGAFVYLIRNISNIPGLLRRANIDLPDTIRPVSSVLEGARDLTMRVNEGRI